VHFKPKTFPPLFPSLPTRTPTAPEGYLRYYSSNIDKTLCDNTEGQPSIPSNKKKMSSEDKNTGGGIEKLVGGEDTGDKVSIFFVLSQII
jgi:hypothetical protein